MVTEFLAVLAFSDFAVIMHQGHPVSHCAKTMKTQKPAQPRKGCTLQCSWENTAVTHAQLQLSTKTAGKKYLNISMHTWCLYSKKKAEFV